MQMDRQIEFFFYGSDDFCMTFIFATIKISVAMITSKGSKQKEEN